MIDGIVPLLFGATSIGLYVYNRQKTNENKRKQLAFEYQKKESEYAELENKYEDSLFSILSEFESTGVNKFYYPISSNIFLKKDEKIVVQIRAYATTQELKTTTARERLGYQGFTYSFKIIGGLRYRCGNITPIERITRTTSLNSKNEGIGWLTITNKRVFFDPDQTYMKNVSYTKNTILRIEPLNRREIIIEPTRGKPLILFIDPANQSDFPRDCRFDARTISSITLNSLV